MFNECPVLDGCNQSEGIKSYKLGSKTVRNQETQCRFEEFSLDDTAFAITLWDCEKLCGFEKIDWTEATELFRPNLRTLADPVSKKWTKKVKFRQTDCEVA